MHAQLDAIGAASIPLVCVTAVLSGVVTSQQGGYQFTGSIPLYVLGSVVASSVVLGRSSNGRTDWKDAQGISLKVLQSAATS